MVTDSSVLPSDDRPHLSRSRRADRRLSVAGDEPQLSRRQRRRAERRKRGPVRRVLGVVTEICVVTVTALLLSLVVKTFLVQAFLIPSESMEPALIRGDRVVVSKLTPGPIDLRRGDVVVFRDSAGWLARTTTVRPSQGRVLDTMHSGMVFLGLLPSGADDHLIKRVIGLPGDRVVCCDAGGRVTVNGAPIDEPYLYPGDQPSRDTFSVTVPPGRLWVLGDHRSVSQDSRYHPDLDGGMVKIEDVVGRAVVLAWPFDRLTVLHNPSSSFARVPRP